MSSEQSTKDAPAACALSYLVRGVATDRASQQALSEELENSLNHAVAVVVLPVVDGFAVDLEVKSIAPFTRSSFEPYVAEHILSDAVALRCTPKGAVQLQLLNSTFGDVQ